MGNNCKLANNPQIQTHFPYSSHTCCFSNMCTQTNAGGFFVPKGMGNKYRDPKLLLKNSQKFLKISTVPCEVKRHRRHECHEETGKETILRRF